MFRKNNNNASQASGFLRNNKHKTSVDRYLEDAQAALQASRLEEAYHLYLLAYEHLRDQGPDELSDKALQTLHDAWDIAIRLQERTFAEYVYERLEPHLAPEEVKSYAGILQELALSKLDEVGVSQEELRKMADDITSKINELLGDGFQLENAISDLEKLTSDIESSDRALAERQERRRRREAEFETEREKRKQARKAREEEREKERKKEAEATKNRGFASLVGFDGVIQDLQILGVGDMQDSYLRDFVYMLRLRHGVEANTTPGSILFRTASRSDASQLMQAAVMELGLPSMAIHMQPGPGGNPVLAVTVSSKRGSRPPQFGRLVFESPSALVLGDIDMWVASLVEASSSDDESFGSSARAAREALATIHAAVSNPDVFVFASVSRDEVEDDLEFLLDLLEPSQVIDIDLPTEEERREIWTKLLESHPSLRDFNLDELIRLSQGLSRSAIYRATEETVEESYRSGLRNRTFVPIKPDMLFSHLANYQPLDSSEFTSLQEEVLSAFREGLDDLETEIFDAELHVTELVLDASEQDQIDNATGVSHVEDVEDDTDAK